MSSAVTSFSISPAYWSGVQSHWSVRRDALVTGGDRSRRRSVPAPLRRHCGHRPASAASKCSQTRTSSQAPVSCSRRRARSFVIQAVCSELLTGRTSPTEEEGGSLRALLLVSRSGGSLAAVRSAPGAELDGFVRAGETQRHEDSLHLCAVHVVLNGDGLCRPIRRGQNDLLHAVWNETVNDGAVV